jgi:hypothetical protein
VITRASRTLIQTRTPLYSITMKKGRLSPAFLLSRSFPIDLNPPSYSLSAAINDAALRQIVWCELNGDLVARENADVVFAHLA